MLEAILALLGLGVVVNATLLVILLGRSSAARQDHTEAAVREELRLAREESGKTARELREEMAQGAKLASDSLDKTLSRMIELQKTQLGGVTQQIKDLSETNNAALERVRTMLDSRVKELQDSNEKKLQEMRTTVDEKLQGTLEKRLGESFKLVSERLEAVQRGLGEMQSLAVGVGDLKRVLTNVKVRGTWAEVQLGSILEQILSPGQYEKNVRTKEDSRDSVEYALCLPGPKNDPGAKVWLPIDSKFPQEDYLRLQQAAEAGDAQAVQVAMAGLAGRVRLEAQKIHDKYLNPPKTTDIAIMFLATEGLYAEVVKQPGLVDDIQQRYRIIPAGPTTLAAILSSIRMGFQTLALEQQAAVVWKILGAVKTEFGKFGDVLSKVKRQLNSAANTIEETEHRTRIMAKKLRAVEEIPDHRIEEVLQLPPAAMEMDEDDSDSDPDAG